MEDIINQIYLNLPILKKLDIKINIEKLENGNVVISFDHNENLERRGGILFGGFIALMFDFVLGMTVRTINEHSDQVTISLSIHFLNKAKSKRYFVEGKVVKKGRSIVFVEGFLYDEQNTLLAKAYGIWKIF